MALCLFDNDSSNKILLIADHIANRPLFNCRAEDCSKSKQIISLGSSSLEDDFTIVLNLADSNEATHNGYLRQSDSMKNLPTYDLTVLAENKMPLLICVSRQKIAFSASKKHLVLWCGLCLSLSVPT